MWKETGVRPTPINLVYVLGDPAAELRRPEASSPCPKVHARVNALDMSITESQTFHHIIC